jgi:hypothetical protein
MRYSVLFLLIIIYLQPGFCQTGARISDVDFHLKDNFIVINYNLAGTLPKEELTIELAFITENGDTLIPISVYGDIGTKVFSDGLKEIQWDILFDKVKLTGNLKATVKIASSSILYSGPSNALLSVIVPGLGGYFVEKNKIRAAATTVTTIGLIAYGVSQKLKSDKYYSDYNLSKKSVEIQQLYTNANNAQHRFYISTCTAVGIWAMDILWVTYKGLRNKEEAENRYKTLKKDGLELNYSNNGLQLGYHITF